MNLSITIKIGPRSEKNDYIEYAFDMNQLEEEKLKKLKNVKNVKNNERKII